jgi:hypothetical protein
LASKAKVKVPTPQSINVDEIRESLKKEVSETLQQNSLDTYKAIQSALLTDRFPTWQTDVAKPEFTGWLDSEDTKQPGLKNMFLASNNANEIGGVLKNFHAHVAAKAQLSTPKPKPKTPVVNRSQRLAEALPVRGTQSSAPMPKTAVTEEDGFELAASEK